MGFQLIYHGRHGEEEKRGSPRITRINADGKVSRGGAKLAKTQREEDPRRFKVKSKRYKVKVKEKS